MRHLKATNKLGVSNSHREALIRSLSLALIEKETIHTTIARAKALRSYADRVVTLAKYNDLASRRRLVQFLGSTETNIPGQNRVRLALRRVYDVLVPRFKDRISGYTQILRLSQRRSGDNAEMCMIRYIPSPEKEKKKVKETGAKGKKSGSRKKGEEVKASDTKKVKA